MIHGRRKKKHKIEVFTIPHPCLHLQSQWGGNTGFPQCFDAGVWRPDQDNWHTSQTTFAKQWWMCQCWLLAVTPPTVNIPNKCAPLKNQKTRNNQYVCVPQIHVLTSHTTKPIYITYFQICLTVYTTAHHYNQSPPYLLLKGGREGEEMYFL